MTKHLRWASLGILLMLGTACDPYHKDKCEWYLVPEPAHVDLVDEGWVSLCARNFLVNNQRCYLRSTLEYAKAVYGKPFRMNTLKVRDIGPYPREVESIKACQPSEDEVERLKIQAQQPSKKPEVPATDLDD